MVSAAGEVLSLASGSFSSPLSQKPANQPEPICPSDASQSHTIYQVEIQRLISVTFPAIPPSVPAFVPVGCAVSVCRGDRIPGHLAIPARGFTEPIEPPDESTHCLLISLELDKKQPGAVWRAVFFDHGMFLLSILPLGAPRIDFLPWWSPVSRRWRVFVRFACRDSPRGIFATRKKNARCNPAICSRSMLPCVSIYLTAR